MPTVSGSKEKCFEMFQQCQAVYIISLSWDVYVRNAFLGWTKSTFKSKSGRGIDNVILLYYHAPCKYVVFDALCTFIENIFHYCVIVFYFMSWHICSNQSNILRAKIRELCLLDMYVNIKTNPWNEHRKYVTTTQLKLVKFKHIK